MSGWDAVDWTVFAASFAGWLVVGWVLADLVHRAGRKLQKDRLQRAKDLAPEGALLSRNGNVWTYWSQVGALDFRRYIENEDGRVELERVVYEDTPGGRLAAKDFFATHNVTGPKVLHTRDTGRR